MTQYIGVKDGRVSTSIINYNFGIIVYNVEKKLMIDLYLFYNHKCFALIP